MIHIDDIKKYYPIDRSIKKIFLILTNLDETIKKIPKLSNEEKCLLVKYIFTYAKSDVIKSLIKFYKIKICDDHMNYYLSNDNWNREIFELALKSGLNPDLKSIIRAYRIYMIERKKPKINYIEEKYINLLERRINELVL